VKELPGLLAAEGSYHTGSIPRWPLNGGPQTAYHLHRDGQRRILHRRVRAFPSARRSQSSEPRVIPSCAARSFRQLDFPSLRPTGRRCLDSLEGDLRPRPEVVARG
jgi:hypothetical protein